MLFSYCTNIHPGDSWEENFQSLRTHVPGVRKRIRRSPTDPFPLGLRIGAQAAGELIADKMNIRKLKAWLEEENMLAYTINGFPFGTFHGTRVKEQVFAPDWSQPERVDYTRRLFDLLGELLPEGSEGSVSTLPGSFQEFVTNDPTRHAGIMKNLREFALDLDKMAEKHGIDFHLGLEPEPLGLMDDTSSTLAFFDRLRGRLTRDEEDALERRIGICYDTCHFAVAHEDAAPSLNSFKDSRIRLSKVHLSNALSLDPRDPEAINRLKDFDEPTYLHQVVSRRADGSQSRFRDIPDAMAVLPKELHSGAEEWRVHFHIPLYAEPDAPMGSTIFHLAGLAQWLQQHPGQCRHFEMETYTFNVLPESLRQNEVEAMLAEEFRWCETRFFSLTRRELA